MSFRMLKIASAIAALTLATPALAQDAQPPAAGGATAPAPAVPGAPVAATPQFQVEVLIFSHRDFDPSEEQFAHADVRATRTRDEQPRPPPVFDDTNFGPNATGPSPVEQTPLPGGATRLGGDSAPANPNEFWFRLLRPEELQLTKEFRTLERLKEYHPIVHGGWVQPGVPENLALPIDLGVLGVVNPMGTISVYLSRFLHAKIDLSYLDNASPLAVAPSLPPGPAGLAELPIAPRYHLSQERQMRSGELHYFDHPAFGVLIKITPVHDESTPGGRPAA